MTQRARDYTQGRTCKSCSAAIKDKNVRGLCLECLRKQRRESRASGRQFWAAGD